MSFSFCLDYEASGTKNACRGKYFRTPDAPISDRNAALLDGWEDHAGIWTRVNEWRKSTKTERFGTLC